MKLKNLHEFFIFTGKEKRGILILLCLITLLIATDLLLPFLYRGSKFDFAPWKKEIDGYLASKDTVNYPNVKIAVSFNPNETDSGKLVKMGVPPRVAGNWGRYLKKGGRFKRKEELKKIYGMTPELYEELKLCVTFAPEQIKARKPAGRTDSVGRNISFAGRKNFQKKIYTPVNLNEADSAALENLPGIGPVLASRIIRYREILGGFYSIEQMHEVYGLRPENYLSVSPYLFVGQDGYRKFNVNFSTLSELGRHPYIGYHTARKILNLRDRKGKLIAAGELSGLMGNDSLKKVIPYLVFGP